MVMVVVNSVVDFRGQYDHTLILYISLQKQLYRGVVRNSFSSKFRNMYKKVFAVESFFSKAAGLLQSATLLKNNSITGILRISPKQYFNSTPLCDCL